MTELTIVPPQPQVPQSYAEKAMASLMQLHDELMEEKEKRLELTRTLMDREQQLAELKAYVRLLESRLPPVPGATTASAAPTSPTPPSQPSSVARAPGRPSDEPPKPPSVAPPRRGEEWKVW